MRNADSHTNADTDTHSNAYPDTNAHSDADANANANAYPDTRLKLLRLCRRNFVRAESGCHQ